MPLTRLQFKPGINRETTSSSNEGGWFDSNKIRFRFGYPEKIGGWTKYTTESFLGKCRALKAWMALDSTKYLGIGTSRKYYIEDGLTFSDITPIRATTSAGGISAITAPNTTINANISATATTISLTSASNFAPSGYIKIDSEVILYGSVDSSNNDLLNCTRGQKGTTAASHSSGAVVGTSTLKVTDASHGATKDSFVTISGATALGGNIAANILNQEYQIFSVGTADANTYYINARTYSAGATDIKSLTSDGVIADTFVFSNADDDSTGGSNIVGTYQLNVGLDDSVTSVGWGAGPWNAGTWNTTVSTVDTMRIWSHDNFGEDLLINVRDGNIAYWDKSNGTGTEAVLLSSLSNSNKAPSVSKQIMVSDRDRHVIAFGCDSGGDPLIATSAGTQDPLLIRFSDQESVIEWETKADNTAGFLVLGSGSEIIMAVETRQQILVFTDTSVHSMQYIGPPFTFGINVIAEGVTVAGPMAAVSVENNVFWMGLNEFYVYSGSVQRLPCTVKDYVFSDFNSAQIEKVTASLNSSFGEVWWFYPSSSSTENNRYVVYNYEQQIWYYGTMDRTAWMDRGIKSLPLAASSDNYLYSHETGFDDGSTSPSTAITAHIQSSQIDIGEGDNFLFLTKVIPDLTFRNSSTSTPSANLTFYTKNFPGKGFAQNQSGTVTQSVAGTTSVIEQFTEEVNLRLRGRSFSMKLESTGKETTWRLGTPKVDVRPDGKR
tara:strand:+ start:1357 stop:3516 length:2160 start_codon:yes stop_codon:yes gene_type:complete